jgi:hypothetical protein
MIKPWSVGPYYPCQVGKLMMAVLLNSIHIFPFQPFDFALSYLDVHYLHRTVSPLIRDTLLSFIHPTLYFNPPLLTCFHHHLPLLFRPCPSTNLYTTATPPARDCNLLETQRHIDIHLEYRINPSRLSSLHSRIIRTPRLGYPSILPRMVA